MGLSKAVSSNIVEKARIKPLLKRRAFPTGFLPQALFCSGSFALAHRFDAL
jgi:hypothetical protein